MLSITSRDQVAPVFRLPTCALHPDRLAVVDCATNRGWANLCTTCFLAFGKGLGMGLGQVLMPEEREDMIAADPTTVPCHSCGARWVEVQVNRHRMTHTKDCLYNLAVEAFPDFA
jgi:hypothetical protein